MENTEIQSTSIPTSTPEVLTPSFQSTPSLKKTHPLRTLFIGLVFVLFGVLLGVLATRFLPLSGNSTGSISDITGWEIYTSPNYGFSFRFPTSWSIQDVVGVSGNDLLTVSLVSPESRYVYEHPGKNKMTVPSPDIQIFVEPKLKVNDISGSYSIKVVRENLLNNREAPVASNVSQVVINNVTFTKAKILADPSYLTYVTENNNKYIALDFGNSDTSLSPLKSLILSTFEFTPPISDSARVEICKKESACKSFAAGSVGCANPASKFCTCMGGTLSPQENEKGQFSLCAIDGEKVEEWVYFRSKTNVPSSYSCPYSEWVDCMPGPDSQNPQCTNDFLTWAKANCPNFKGAAL